MSAHLPNQQVVAYEVRHPPAGLGDGQPPDWERQKGGKECPCSQDEEKDGVVGKLKSG